MSPEVYLVWHLTLTFGIGVVACLLTTRFLNLSDVPLTVLWSFYYVIGFFFHLCSWLSGDAQTYAFIGLAGVHLFAEILVCIKSLEGKPTVVNWWARRFSVYYLVVSFVSLILWQPLNLFAIGSLLALPVDILVVPAAYSLMQRATQARDPSLWWLGLIWACNGPIVCGLFAQLTWNVKQANTHIAVGATMLQLQYLAMGVCWIRTFGRLEPSRVGKPTAEQEQCVELGLLPSSKHGDGITSEGERRPLVASAANATQSMGMATALKITGLLVTLEFLVAIVAPIVLGKLDLKMIFVNACVSFAPGNVQALGNVGPNFLLPIDCSAYQP